MMPHSPERLKRAVEQSQDDYVRKLDAQWLETVPHQYRGHSIKEVTGGTVNRDGVKTTYEPGWNGTLSDSEIDRVEGYLENPTTFLILRGDSGVGKSTLAATIARRLIHQFIVPGRFVNSVSMLHEFSFREENNDPVKHFAKYGVLVIDDMGVANEALTAHQQKSLWNLIEARWSNKDKFTIITTNMAIQDNDKGVGLSSWIGESGWDRISSELTRIRMSGDSLR